MARDVTIDVVAHDKTDRAVKSATRNFEKLRKATDDNSKSTEKADNWTKKLGTSLLGAARAVGAMGARVAGFTSMLGPLSLGLVHVIIASAHLVSAMSPLLAVLASVAAAGIFLKLTFKAIGPAMAAGVKPVTEAWARLSVHLGKIASAGLPQLSRAFVKVNFPWIRLSTEVIARSINGIVVSVGKWLNTTQGMRTIGAIVARIAVAFERLAPHIAALIPAILRFTAAGSPGLLRISSLLGKLIDKTAAWMNSMTPGRVLGALQQIGGAFQWLTGKARMLLDIGKWMASNTAKVKAFSDALAIVGIVLGAMTLNVVPAIAGSLTLLANHWDWVKQTVSNFAHSEAWAVIKVNFEAAKKIVMDGLRKLQPEFMVLIGQLQKLGHEVLPMLGPLFRTWATAAVGAIAAITTALIALTATMRAVVAVWKFVVRTALDALGLWLGGIQRVVAVFARLPGPLGAPFRAMLGPIQGAIDKVNALRSSMDALPTSKTFTYSVVVKQTQQTGRNTSGPHGPVIPFSGLGGSFRGGTPEGTHRIGGPAPVVTVNPSTQVFIDGREIRSMARTAINEASSRQAWRARTGRR